MSKTKAELINDIAYWTARIEEDLTNLKNHSAAFYNTSPTGVVKFEELDPTDTYVAMYVLKNAKMDLEIHQNFLYHAVEDLKLLESNTPKWKKILKSIFEL